MKKLIYVFIFLTLFVTFDYVKADEANISYEYLDGIFYNQVIDGNLSSNRVTSFHLNDRIAYCIEPGVSINTKVYDTTDWTSINLSDDLKEYIEKVGYYGYEYPSHQTNYYYIAAQELIWKAVRPDIEVAWTTGKNMTGDVIDVSREKEEIESLVNSHSLLPSFAMEAFSGYTGEEIILTDENNVLDYYDVQSSENHEIIKENNTLKIKLNSEKIPEETITLTRKYYDNAPLIIYQRGDSQKLAALRITTDKVTYFKISNIERPKPEEPQVIEVPNTGVGVRIYDCIDMIISGVGMIIGAIKIT